MREKIVTKGSDPFQKKNGPFSKDKKARWITSAWFSKTLPDGRKQNRSWIAYSPKTEAAYFIPCILFSNTPANSESLFKMKQGFKKWKDSSPVVSHEQTSWHRQAFAEWKEMEMHLRGEETIKEKLVQEIETEWSKGRHILTALLACIKFLAKRNLAFHGSSDKVDDDKGEGNFLALVKHIAEFEPIPKIYLKKSGDGGRATYRSDWTQNKFITLLADEVRQDLVRAIEEGKYFGLMCDSTPDISCRDQHALVILHMTGGEVKDSFPGFLKWSEKPHSQLFLESWMLWRNLDWSSRTAGQSHSTTQVWWWVQGRCEWDSQCCPAPQFENCAPHFTFGPLVSAYIQDGIFKMCTLSRFWPLLPVFDPFPAISWRRAWVGAKTGVQTRLRELNE